MISFVIPAYNEETLIIYCLASIKAEAAGRPHEIIVVDNGSTDSTAKLAALLGAVVISEQRKGVTRARQTGLEASKYDLVAFVDADNVVPSGWVDAAVKAVSAPGAVAASGPVVYGDMRISKRLLSIGFYCVAKVMHQLLPMLQGGNFIVKRQALIEAGGFDTSIDFFGEDTSTSVRMCKVGKVKFDFGMWLWSSARRMEHEGMFRTGSRYIVNYLWIWIAGKPWTSHYNDIRPK